MIKLNNPINYEDIITCYKLHGQTIFLIVDYKIKKINVRYLRSRTYSDAINISIWTYNKTRLIEPFEESPFLNDDCMYSYILTDGQKIFTSFIDAETELLTLLKMRELKIIEEANIRLNKLK